MVLDIQISLFFHLVHTRINERFFWRVSPRDTAIQIRSMNFPNYFHALVAIVPVPCWLLIGNTNCPGECKRLNSNGTSVGISQICGNSTSPFNFPFKIVASIILFNIFLIESIVRLQSRDGLLIRRKMWGKWIQEFVVFGC